MENNAKLTQTIDEFSPNTKNLMHDNSIWTLFPYLMFAAAFLPQIYDGFTNLSNFNFYTPIYLNNGGFVKQFLLNGFGFGGLELFDALRAILNAFGIWLIARALGAPFWARSLVSGLSFAASIFAISLNAEFVPDDALFGALISICIGYTLMMMRDKSQKHLALAFVFAAIATIFRPYCAWPQFLVFLCAIFSTNVFEERPFYGLLSALLWGPLLYIFCDITAFAINGIAMPNISQYLFRIQLKLSAISNLNPKQLMGMMDFIPNIIVMTILMIIGAFGLYISWVSGLKNRLKILPLFIMFSIIMMGIIGYGDYKAARFIIDPICFGAFAVLILLLTTIAKRTLNSKNK